MITGAQIVTFTGVMDLASLATDGELVLNDFAGAASDAIYRKLKARGIVPDDLSNDAEFKDAVAYEAVYRLALGGYLPNVSVQDMKEAAREALEVKPEYASSDSPRNVNEGIPAVGHVDGGPAFSGGFDVDDPGYFNDGYPSAL